MGLVCVKIIPAKSAQGIQLKALDLYKLADRQTKLTHPPESQPVYPNSVVHHVALNMRQILEATEARILERLTAQKIAAFFQM